MSSLQMALTLEHIWLMRNRVVHDGEQIQILSLTKSLEHMFWEVS